jgi:hypothetical protein
MPDPFFAIFSHTPARRSTCSSSQASNSAASRKAITAASLTEGFVDTLDSYGGRGALQRSSAVAEDVEVVAVVHDA